MSPVLHDTLVEALRVLFLISIPVTVAVALVGLLVGVLQGVTTIRDSASEYALKLLALVAVLFFLGASFSSSVTSLLERALS